MQHYRERRLLTNHDIQITRDEETWRGIIINATARGLRLKSAAPLELEDRITITGGSWSVEAVVVWIKDGAFGVKLDKPMETPLVARLTGKAMRLNRRSRVGFGVSNL
jgi:hypothetical protein